jgi:hypothetical protein
VQNSGSGSPLATQSNTALGFGLGRCISTPQESHAPQLLVAIADELIVRGLMADLLDLMEPTLRQAVTLQISVARSRSKTTFRQRRP